MEVLKDEKVGVVRTASIGEDEAVAYGRQMRRRIARALYRRRMTTAEIVALLDGEGVKKVRPTVCYHLEILKKAGVVDVAKISTVRGMVEKYYTARVKVLEHSAPEDFEETYSSEIGSAERKMEKLLGQLAPRVAGRIPRGADDPDYEQFVLAEIVNRAMTRVFEARSDGDSDDGDGDGKDGSSGKGARRGGGAARKPRS